MAAGFFDRRAGFAQFTQARIQDAGVLALAAKIRYSINPNDEYPRNFTGHLRATLTDGSRREIRRPYMRGGMHAPLSQEELDAKFMDNVLYGGWRREQGERVPAALSATCSTSRRSVRWRSSARERRRSARPRRHRHGERAQHRPRHRSRAGGRRARQ